MKSSLLPVNPGNSSAVPVVAPSGSPSCTAKGPRSVGSAYARASPTEL